MQVIRGVSWPRVLTTVVILLSWITSAGNAEPRQSDAEAIFARARDAASIESCPNRMDYVIVVEATIAGRVVQNHYSATYSFDTDVLHVASITEEERRAAGMPRGTNVVITLPGIPLVGLSRKITSAVNNSEATSDLIGVPQLKPAYTFGLKRHMAKDASVSRDSANGEAEPLRVLGTTHAHRRDYTLELLGVDGYGESKAFHLRASPVREPSRFRLRELWVDAKSYGLVAIVSQGNFADGPATKAKWLTTYQDIRGCHVIDAETALDRLDYGKNRTFQTTTRTFSVEKNSSADDAPVLTFRLPQRSGDVVEPDE